MNFKKKILLSWVIFALLDPDPDSGSTDPIESGSNPDPQTWLLPKELQGKERFCQFWLWSLMLLLM
jgi:hypothetical protein